MNDYSKFIFTDELKYQISPFIYSGKPVKNIWNECYFREVQENGNVLLPLKSLDVTQKLLKKNDNVDGLIKLGCFVKKDFNFYWTSFSPLGIIFLALFLLPVNHGEVTFEMLLVFCIDLLLFLLVFKTWLERFRKAKWITANAVTCTIMVVDLINYTGRYSDMTKQTGYEKNQDEMLTTGKISGYLYFSTVSGRTLWISNNDLKLIDTFINGNQGSS